MSIFKLSIAAATSVLTFAAQAAPTVYFGENPTACTTAGVRSTCTVSGAPLTASNTFLGQLSGVGTENFESYANGDGQNAPLPILFPGSNGTITATINPESNGVSFVSNGTSTPMYGDEEHLGRWNTSPEGGANWFRGVSFSINFDTAISAFGFFGTDIGDVEGSLGVTLTAEDGTTTGLAVSNSFLPNGSLLFWGFLDTTTRYTRIAFDASGPALDAFGFDGMTIGDQAQITNVPEPGTLALLGLGLVGLAELAFTRRRKE